MLNMTNKQASQYCNVLLVRNDSMDNESDSSVSWAGNQPCIKILISSENLPGL